MAKRFRNCIGPQVRKLRNAKGLTQEQLSARMQLAGLHSIDRVGVAKIEAQIRSVFDYEAAVIAAELSVDPSDLFPAKKVLKVDLNDLISGKR